MKDCYKLFIQLSLQQCLKNDYNDKEKVKTQNKATKKLQQIQKEMKQVDCFDTYLTDENSVVGIYIQA